VPENSIHEDHRDTVKHLKIRELDRATTPRKLKALRAQPVLMRSTEEILGG